MISNSTHFWFSVGAPRAMFIPYPKDIMDSFIPIEKGFKQYPAGTFDFVHAEITGVEGEKKTVLYKLKNEKDETAANTETASYDSLVLATGSKGPSPLYSYQGSHVPTLDAYKDIQSRLPSAKSIMIVGGGTAGTETAGETLIIILEFYSYDPPFFPAVFNMAAGIAYPPIPSPPPPSPQEYLSI